MQLGRQTPGGVTAGKRRKIIGTSPRNIEDAEDRDIFQQLARRLNIEQHLMESLQSGGSSGGSEKIQYPFWYARRLCLGAGQW